MTADGYGWFVSLGAFDPKASTNIRLDAFNGEYGTNLHLESDLDLPQRRVVPQAVLGYRFTRRPHWSSTISICAATAVA